MSGRRRIPRRGGRPRYRLSGRRRAFGERRAPALPFHKAGGEEAVEAAALRLAEAQVRGQGAQVAGRRDRAGTRQSSSLAADEAGGEEAVEAAALGLGEPEVRGQRAQVPGGGDELGEAADLMGFDP